MQFEFRNPIYRLTRDALGGGLFSPLPFFLDIWQTNGAIKAKLTVPFEPSILHPMCQQKIRTYHKLAANDVRVTSCPCLVYKNRSPRLNF